MTIKSVAMDLEGTLVDVERAHHEAFLRVAADYGFVLSFEEAIERIPGFIGGGDPAVLRGILRLLGSDEGQVEALRLQKMKYYNEILKEMEIRPRPGSVRVIRWFQRNGFKVMLGSLTPKVQAAVLFNKTGLDKIIGRENIILGEDVRNPKPAPDIFLKTAERAGVAPQEQLVFEDSAVGIQAAKAAGSIPIAMPVYNMPAVIKALAEAGAVRIFMDWRKINIRSLLSDINKTLAG